MNFSSDTPLSNIIDYGEINNQLRNIDTENPYSSVLQKLTKDKHKPIVELQSYINGLVSIACGAKHERADCEYGVPNCPIRRNNIACLHGLDFRLHPTDGHIQFGINTWATKVFVLAYILQKYGYDIPLFVTNPGMWLKWCDKNDVWEINLNRGCGEGKLYSDINPETMKFQKIMGSHFQSKYVLPIKDAFGNFWDTQII